jgi:hypothetical protein
MNNYMDNFFKSQSLSLSLSLSIADLSDSRAHDRHSPRPKGLTYAVITAKVNGNKLMTAAR